MILRRVQLWRVTPISWVVSHSSRACFCSANVTHKFVRLLLDRIGLITLLWLSSGLFLLFFLLASSDYSSES